MTQAPFTVVVEPSVGVVVQGRLVVVVLRGAVDAVLGGVVVVEVVVGTGEQAGIPKERLVPATLTDAEADPIDVQLTRQVIEPSASVTAGPPPARAPLTDNMAGRPERPPVRISPLAVT